MTGMMGYGHNAKKLAEQYESITFFDIHRDVLHLFPQSPFRVLDVGAGSGRDAAALAADGNTVVAVEPTAELRQEGMRIHAGKAINWVDDQLPHLTNIHAHHAPFDLILLTAVWMHLNEAERYDSMASIAGLLKPGGRVSMSLRHGPVPHGRKMFAVSAAETTLLASSFGLRSVLNVEREDMLGRNDVRWSFMVLENTTYLGSTPINFRSRRS
ncbi:class I SAM-dependent methyltransferase [Paracoccus saliphilus]|uniref:Class I SAM-dependent methyltransferase n=1 Tax=Paracoccus saliphilus TaxID=405559 RepID=A0AA46A7F5_9RHOB|nr:class I SAM-dependent methyltransferase [Paracoccus saliphilus]WCR04806.1 class I SAM-dependent methyltransferase [Paracoccus saliphilus]SIT12832.1 Methyltransferase domain-containing protein [Paracoccus saliphilus]